MHDLQYLFAVNLRNLYLVGAAIAAYSVLEGVEAVGLWLGKRWAEYLKFKWRHHRLRSPPADYEQSRPWWPGLNLPCLDRRPGLILRCTSTQDVVAAVTVAREHGLAPAVRPAAAISVAARGGQAAMWARTADLAGAERPADIGRVAGSQVTVDPERRLVHAGRRREGDPGQAQAGGCGLLANRGRSQLLKP